MAQAGLVLLALLAFAAGPAFGGVALCGLFAGAFLPNAGLIRYARVNREMAAAEGEQQLAQAQAKAGPSVQLAPDERTLGVDAAGAGSAGRAGAACGARRGAR